MLTWINLYSHNYYKDKPNILIVYNNKAISTWNCFVFKVIILLTADNHSCALIPYKGKS